MSRLDTGNQINFAIVSLASFCLGSGAAAQDSATKTELENLSTVPEYLQTISLPPIVEKWRREVTPNINQLKTTTTTSSGITLGNNVPQIYSQDRLAKCSETLIEELERSHPLKAGPYRTSPYLTGEMAEGDRHLDALKSDRPRAVEPQVTNDKWIYGALLASLALNAVAIFRFMKNHASGR